MKTTLIATALIVACWPVFASEILAGPYAADILRVIDGDTVEARIRVWLGQDVTTHVRIRGIDAPELRGHCPGEPEAAEAARAHLARLLAVGPVMLTGIGYDKYGRRIDAAIQLRSGEDISAAMLAARRARPWPRSKGDRPCRP